MKDLGEPVNINDPLMQRYLRLARRIRMMQDALADLIEDANQLGIAIQEEIKKREEEEKKESEKKEPKEKETSQAKA